MTVSMAGNPDVVEVFECEGSFSFLRETHQFTFSIHSDSSLRVDVKPFCAAGQVEDVAVDQERAIRGTIEDIDDVEEEQEGQAVREAIAEEDAVQEVDEVVEPEAEDGEEETAAKLLAYDGRALVEMPPQGETDETHPVSYVVHFKIVQWGRGAQGMWSQIVKCIARLSIEYGMTGRFSDVGEDPNQAQDFALAPVAHRLEPLDSPLHPLTPGRYELRGITIAENAFVYECAVNITLQANGMMSGTSRELPFAQECPLAGMWTRSGLNYLLQYEMHGNKHTYIYFGTPFRSGLQGTWQNSELRVLGNNLDARASQAERGVLEFQLVKTVRVWSEEYHKDYPAAFRECVKLMLLASHRDMILPNHLWSSIVSYCGYNWFHSDQQNSLALSEAKDSSDSEAPRVP
ncbi:Chaperone protein DnaJ [Phytophthora cinnamomi]|uniref:Chaperone protein DnaJ n=1 Tax=Phytophthora cinnamomi TaxID=4785 RepID=UPI00355A7D51|nr:Chaperone protein DnaJ [Phytophthora cinnamomi]